MFKRRQSRPATTRAIRSVIEGLEGRTLLSVASLNSAGMLNVHGTGHGDAISVTMDAQNSSMVDVSVDGKVASYDSAHVEHIRVNGGGGADQVTIDNSVSTPTTILGSGGNDTLVAGGGDDSLNGGSGNDSLEGGGGSDDLIGGAGNDTLVGGTGNSAINGGAGNDSLRGGAGDDDLLGGNGNDTLASGTGDDHVDAGKGKDQVNFNSNAGVALNTLPAAVQTGLTTLAQGATITSVLSFHEDGQTYYGTTITLNGVDTRIVVDASGNPVTQSQGQEPDGPGPGDQQASAYGSVVSVDASAGTITLSVTSEHGPAKQTTFSVTSATTLTADGATISLGSLVAGAWVNVQPSSTDPTTAASITAIDRRIEGTVSAVDTTANTITLANEQGVTTTYTLNASVTITSHDTAIALSSVAINSHVELTLAALDGTVLNIEVSGQDNNQGGGGGDNGGGGGDQGEPQTVSGSVSAIDTTADTLALADGGTTTTYTLTSTTAVFLNGNPSTPAAITPGVRAELHLAADGMTIVTLQAETPNPGGDNGGGGDGNGGGGDQTEPTEVNGPIASLDTTANTITLQGDGGTTKSYNLTATTTIKLNDASSTLAALPTGASAELKLAADGTVISIQAESHAETEDASGPIASVDTVANTITLQGDGGTTKTYNLTATTTIKLNDASNTLAALPTGASAELKLAADGTVTSIQAESHAETEDASGPIASVDTVANTITLQGDGGTTKTYTLTATTTIKLNDASSTLAALPTGASAELKLAADGTVISIQAESHAETEDASGPIASVDTAANTITLQGDGGTTKTYNLTATTTIKLNDASSTLAALPTGASAELKLAADGTVVSISVEVHH